MASLNPTSDTRNNYIDLKQNQSLMIGLGAAALGFAIGSGRLNWLSQETLKIARNLGLFAVKSMANSFQEKHPNYFSSNQKPRVTH